MDLYTTVSKRMSRVLTIGYSNSFGLSSKLFSPAIRPEIYAIYGLVRIADEIVDTYKGADSAVLLRDLQRETYAAIDRGYSTNPVVHAFADVARRYDIDAAIIDPFFASMRMDLEPQSYTPDVYAIYIHGSAEVIGLMCLKVFCGGNNDQYEVLKPGAVALGAGYQKVNFLRDIAVDYNELHRLYFPGISYDTFSEEQKQAILADIAADLNKAHVAILRLPRSARAAVATSYVYYSALYKKLSKAPVHEIKQRRVRLNAAHKLLLLAYAFVRYKVFS